MKDCRTLEQQKGWMMQNASDLFFKHFIHFQKLIIMSFHYIIDIDTQPLLSFSCPPSYRNNTYLFIHTFIPIARMTLMPASPLFPPQTNPRPHARDASIINR